MTVSANEDQLLLRGSNVRNTPVAATGGTNGWVVGLVDTAAGDEGDAELEGCGA